MVNLFSMFDPSNYFLSACWLMLVLPIIFKIKSPWKKIYSAKMNLFKVKLIILKEIKQIVKPNNTKMATKIFTVVFYTLMTINTLALIPFNFTTTAHLPISMVVALVLWLSIISYGLVENTNKFIAHLTPMGTPDSLMNFMVIIETISVTIRPITLFVRLTANMVAGHILMELTSQASMSSFKSTSTLIMPTVALTMLELAVSIIQAYVMMTLFTLYFKENF